jgi:OOP family OmpA-OmpF porin
MSVFRLVSSIGCGLGLLVALACATPSVDPIPTGPLVPGARERVVVDQAVLIVDSSRSITRRELFPQAKALVESFAAGMPEGSYAAGAVAFGGAQRQHFALEPHRPERMTASAAAIQHLEEGTPLDAVLRETRDWLEGQRERAAVVIFSDGVPTDAVGRDVAPALVLEAARALDEAYAGTVCFHTVQVGSQPAGAELLGQLAQTTPCGSFRQAGSVRDVASLSAFEREVFLGARPAEPAPRTAAPAPRDSDRDGVGDAEDVCPATPAGARVDRRGCWTIEGLTFATNSHAIEGQFHGRLQNVVAVLKQNPKLRVRIDGHTDSRGSDAYNQQLSERRADAVRDHLVSAGIDASRLEARGWGEAKPAYPNDTPQNLRANRRTEVTVLQ